MPITDVISNAQDLTLTFIAEYPVSVERLWDAYADPRQLERFWGPVSWPATFTRHDMHTGGESHYYMTGPDGTRHGGWFRYTLVEPYARFEAHDGFANADGSVNEALPTMFMVFVFERTPTGSRCTSRTQFSSIEAMEQVVQMGVIEGTKSAMSQIDDVLADLRSYAADLPVGAQMLSDTQVRISRVIRGTPEQVWRAHNEAALMQRWMLGPDGWTMPVCDVAERVGETYRYEWESVDKGQRFGFEGELLEAMPPVRAVTMERPIGMPGEGARNELTLIPAQGGTLLTLVVTYPSKAVRDMVLATGMTTGMEISYERLERELLAAV